jgi:hypothetical protein
MFPTIGKEMQTGSTSNPISHIFLMLAPPIYWSKMVISTDALMRYTVKAVEMLASHLHI